MADIVVKAKGIHKQFRPPHQVSSVKTLFTNIFRHKKHHVKPHVVLDGIDLEIRKGEFFGIVGRNGSGKSTLLKILAGIYQPSEGSLKVEGRLVPFIELGVGFNPELTGKDNVYLNGAMLGFSRTEISSMYESIVEFAELQEFMDEKLKNYSSGMQVRLAFSMAIRADADILLIDEVLAVGDASFQKKCYDYFFELKRNGKTVVFISHDMSAIKTYCDKVVLIESGKIISEGEVSRVAEAYFRLFQDASDTTKNIDSSERWGNKKLSINAPTIRVSENEFNVRITIAAESDVSEYTLGISVHDRDTGEILLGTNSELLGKRLPIMKASNERTFIFSVPNVLRDGIYDVGLALHDPKNLPVYDWWDKALILESHYGRNSPYSITPKVKLTVE